MDVWTIERVGVKWPPQRTNSPLIFRGIAMKHLSFWNMQMKSFNLLNPFLMLMLLGGNPTRRSGNENSKQGRKRKTQIKCRSTKYRLPQEYKTLLTQKTTKCNIFFFFWLFQLPIKTRIPNVPWRNVYMVFYPCLSNNFSITTWLSTRNKEQTCIFMAFSCGSNCLMTSSVRSTPLC